MPPTASPPPNSASNQTASQPRGQQGSAHALPPVVDADTWQHHLDELRVREKAATRELDAIAALYCPDV